MNSQKFIFGMCSLIYLAILWFSTSLMVETISPEWHSSVRWAVAFALTALPCLQIVIAFHMWKMPSRRFWTYFFVLGAVGILIGNAIINTKTLEKEITKAQEAITIIQGHKKALEDERNSLQGLANTNEQKVNCTLITLPNGSTKQACNDPNKDLRTQKKDAREKIAQINNRLPTFDEEIAKQQKFIEDNDGKHGRLALMVQVADVLLSIVLALILEYWHPPVKSLVESDKPTSASDLNPGEQPEDRASTESGTARYPRHNVRKLDELLGNVSLQTRKQWTKPKPNPAKEMIDDLKKKNHIANLLRSEHGNS